MYVGVTNNLERRIYEHKQKLVKGFTEKYNVDKLVYFEETNDVNTALAREKEIKKWRREKKNNLVQMINPEWKDLSEDWFKIPHGVYPDDSEGFGMTNRKVIPTRFPLSCQLFLGHFDLSSCHFDRGEKS